MPKKSISKYAEDALLEQNRIMTVLLNNLRVGVFMVEAPSGKPLLANRAAKDLLGRGIVKGSFKDNLAEVYEAYKLGTNEYYPADQMPIFRGLQGHSHAVDDMVVVHPDGKKFYWKFLEALFGINGATSLPASSAFRTLPNVKEQKRKRKNCKLSSNKPKKWRPSANYPEA